MESVQNESKKQSYGRKN